MSTAATGRDSRGRPKNPFLEDRTFLGDRTQNGRRRSPSNGRKPSRAVYRVTPSAHMPEGAPAWPSNCSGAMEWSVPINMPVLVSLVAVSARAG